MSALAYICRVFNKTNKEVAESINVTPQTFNDWIRRKRKIPEKRKKQLADFFMLEENLFDKQEIELDDIARLKIRASFLEKTNEFVFNPEIHDHPFWSNHNEIRKLKIIIENKLLLIEIERLIDGGGFFEDENYNIKSVVNYSLLDGLVKILKNDDKPKIKRLMEIINS